MVKAKKHSWTAQFTKETLKVTKSMVMARFSIKLIIIEEAKFGIKENGLKGNSMAEAWKHSYLKKEIHI
jgi:hypothetical protein